jgi:hypothetical protein
MTIYAGTVARIIQTPAPTVGFDASARGGHNLKRGALSAGMDCGHKVKSDHLSCLSVSSFYQPTVTLQERPSPASPG